MCSHEGLRHYPKTLPTLGFIPSLMCHPPNCVTTENFSNLIQILNLNGFQQVIVSKIKPSHHPEIGGVIQETKILSSFLEAELGGSVIHESCYTRDFTVSPRTKDSHRFSHSGDTGLQSNVSVSSSSLVFKRKMQTRKRGLFTLRRFCAVLLWTSLFSTHVHIQCWRLFQQQAVVWNHSDISTLKTDCPVQHQTCTSFFCRLFLCKLHIRLQPLVCWVWYNSLLARFLQPLGFLGR